MPSCWRGVHARSSARTSPGRWATTCWRCRWPPPAWSRRGWPRWAWPRRRWWSPSTPCAWHGWRRPPLPPPHRSRRPHDEHPAVAGPAEPVAAGLRRGRLRLGGQARPVRRPRHPGAGHPRRRRPPRAAAGHGQSARGPARRRLSAMPLDLPTLTAAFVAGLLGGLHCAAMCGGIATGFPALAPGRPLAVAVQANLGRIGSYVLAGALAGGLGGGILRLARSDVLTIGLRMAAGVALVLVALRLLNKGGRLDMLPGPSQRVWRWLQPLHRRLLPADRTWRRLALGALWGWMPCGLSLSLLSVAWLQANARDGALVMA